VKQTARAQVTAPASSHTTPYVRHQTPLQHDLQSRINRGTTFLANRGAGDSRSAARIVT